MPTPTESPRLAREQTDYVRMRSALQVGAAGLVGGVAGGAAGIWLAKQLVGPIDPEDPWNFVGNTISLIGPLLAIGAGAVGGFVVGVLIAVALLLAVRGPADAGRTLVVVVASEVVVVPTTIVLMVVLGNRWDAVGDIAPWVGALIVGGLTPATACWVAARPR